MLKPLCGRRFRLTLIVSSGALAALLIFPSDVAISLDRKRNLRKPSPANHLHEGGKLALGHNAPRPGSYLDLVVSCRDSNDMRTYFCFWITD